MIIGICFFQLRGLKIVFRLLVRDHHHSIRREILSKEKKKKKTNRTIVEAIFFLFFLSLLGPWPPRIRSVRALAPSLAQRSEQASAVALSNIAPLYSNELKTNTYSLGHGFGTDLKEFLATISYKACSKRFLAMKNHGDGEG